jgi:ABC-type lipoprotein release transport system permease subunit
MGSGGNPVHPELQPMIIEATDVIPAHLLAAQDGLNGDATGIAFALFAGKAATSLLFGLQANDVTTFVFAVGSLALNSLGASYLPALRASRLDPVEALRHE